MAREPKPRPIARGDVVVFFAGRKRSRVSVVGRVVGLTTRGATIVHARRYLIEIEPSNRRRAWVRRWLPEGDFARASGCEADALTQRERRFPPTAADHLLLLGGPRHA